MARSTARKRALNTLYEADEKGQELLSLLAERIAQPGAQTPLPQYAIDIVRGVAEHAADIDAQLDAHSTGWKVKRMAVIDRNILRIATWEIRYNPDVPNGVAINEALTLAKSLSDDEAPAFIHGLLSAIADQPAVTDQQTASEITTSQTRTSQTPVPDAPASDTAASELPAFDKPASGKSAADTAVAGESNTEQPAPHVPAPVAAAGPVES